ncbi:hypothetical protein Ahy_B06g086130 isoform C [Arachis hypogaea]|uniref:Uncharacterized protein n=1 Tax=Arachis hypogaea TaxID=3818 RepID=A0A444YWU9_ARAHY|nr:hypothetical protein Ahy_B06g086130 isoform C [Arachis hypogaea]
MKSTDTVTRTRTHARTLSFSHSLFHSASRIFLSRNSTTPQPGWGKLKKRKHGSIGNLRGEREDLL